MNTIGKSVRTTIFGKSHGEVTGMVMDGIPAGVPLEASMLEEDIARRASGAPGTTQRKEQDIPQIISGVYEGLTDGTPLVIIFRNEDICDEDYDLFAATPRPGHADYVASMKYGWQNDPRGGGQFSGRMTLPMVAAGAVAKAVLSAVQVKAELVEVGGEKDSSKWPELLEQTEAEGDSLGGIVECRASGVPVGTGEPLFDSLESLISHAIFSIPGVRGIEFGDGFAASAMKGSEHNDPFVDGKPAKNGAGGINGGLANGQDIVFRVAFKPTSSIARAQRTWNFETETIDTLEIPGRHDVCFALRTPVVVEALTMLVLLDLACS